MGVSWELHDSPGLCTHKLVTISLLVTRLLSSSHAPQCSGSAWIASTNTSTASLSRSSFRSTTPYLRPRTHTDRHFQISPCWGVHLERDVLTGKGWSRPALLPHAFYWAPPSAPVRPHCAPDPFPEDLWSRRKTKNVWQGRRTVLALSAEREGQADKSLPKLSTVSSSFFFSPD